MASPDTKSSKTMQLQTQAYEYIKSHTEFDVSNRPSVIYTAKTSAANGEPCSKVTYQYLGATALVTGMKEEDATWDASWDF